MAIFQERRSRVRIPRETILSLMGACPSSAWIFLKGSARRRAPHEHAAVSPFAPAKSVLARPVETTAAFDGR
jgi:hypothetical protein